MHLLSCEHPQRVFNKYINEYVWVSCGKCNTCCNAKSARWTDALERERLLHRYCLFVTLTYDDVNLPKLTYGYFGDIGISDYEFKNNAVSLVPSRMHDNWCVPYIDKQLFEDDNDKQLFFGLYKQYGGVPYASGSDLQYFHKRLNKYFHDKFTQKFKNFRYFSVSEYGSTTFRPHFHCIYYTDDSRVAENFKSAVGICWNKGCIDCKFVEKSACCYVAQYVNKLSDLPLFYQKSPLAPKYWFSKFPSIGCPDFTDSSGISNECAQDLQEIFDSQSVTVCCRDKKDSTKFVVTPIDKSVENRLYPKLTQFEFISDSLRVELYSVSGRFIRKAREGFKGFFNDIIYYLSHKYEDENSPFYTPSVVTEFSEYLNENFYRRYLSEDEAVSNAGLEWLRKLYYTSRKVLRNACNFRVSVLTYVRRIEQYYSKKKLYYLSRFYEFQQNYNGLSEDLAIMYPEYLWNNGFTVKDYSDMYAIEDVRLQREDSAFFAQSNKSTHFKNAYLDSLELKRNFYNLFIVLKTYFYAKKCNEVAQALAT